MEARLRRCRNVSEGRTEGGINKLERMQTEERRNDGEMKENVWEGKKD